MEMEMYANGLIEENGGTTAASVVASSTTTAATLDLSSQQQNSYIFGVTDDKVWHLNCQQNIFGRKVG